MIRFLFHPCQQIRLKLCGGESLLHYKKKQYSPGRNQAVAHGKIRNKMGGPICQSFLLSVHCKHGPPPKSDRPVDAQKDRYTQNAIWTKMGRSKISLDMISKKKKNTRPFYEKYMLSSTWRWRLVYVFLCLNPMSLPSCFAVRSLKGDKRKSSKKICSVGFTNPNKYAGEISFGNVAARLLMFFFLSAASEIAWSSW